MHTQTAKRVVASIAAIHVFAVAYFLAFVSFNGYLPQPFFYAPDDTFMDFFNTNYWAHNDSRYTDWRSIYPVFAFVIAQFISREECYQLSPADARGCDSVALSVLLIVSLVAAYFNARLFSTDRVSRWLCFVALVLSFPFLMAIERGNYVLLAYAFLVFAASSRSQKMEGFLLACAINIKQYLLVLLGPVLLNRRYEAVATCLVSVAILNWVSVLYLAEPDFLLLLHNMVLFVDPEIDSTFARVAYAMSPSGFIWYTGTPEAALVLRYLDIEYLMPLARTLEAIIMVVALYIFYRLVRLRRELPEGYVPYVTLVCLFNLTDTPGIYALILFLPYLAIAYPALTRRELITLFILFLPIDASFLDIYEDVGGISFFTGETVWQNYGMMFGSIYRPAAMFYLLVFAALRLARFKKAAEPAGYNDQSGFARQTT